MLKPNQIKGVVFDFDGTLVDSDPIHYSAWTLFLKRRGRSFTKEDFARVSGKQVGLIADYIIKKYKLRITKEELIREKREITLDYFRKRPPKFMPYAKEALVFFSQKGFKLGLATGNLKDVVISILNKGGLNDFFSVIVDGKDVVRGKPYPDIYLLAAQKLGIEPRRCLAIENTQYGVESAKAAGFYAFAVPSGISSLQDFSKADKVFSDLKELILKIQKEGLIKL
ncbi:HAD family phosphatase [bacterium]|nr:HAD family phosphatase [bacterium]